MSFSRGPIWPTFWLDVPKFHAFSVEISLVVDALWGPFFCPNGWLTGAEAQASKAHFWAVETFSALGPQKGRKFSALKSVHVGS